jgi:hypothetical protein
VNLHGCRRQHAHQLIDRLPETQLTALVGLLETIVDPVATALRNAPMDDEPETEEEKEAAAEALAWLQRNGRKGIPQQSTTYTGANAIIALRCCHLNGRFEDYREARRAA